VGQRVAAANKVAYDGQTPEFVFQERQQLADVVTPLTQAVRGPSGALKAEVARGKRQVSDRTGAAGGAGLRESSGPGG